MPAPPHLASGDASGRRLRLNVGDKFVGKASEEHRQLLPARRSPIGKQLGEMFAPGSDELHQHDAAGPRQAPPCRGTVAAIPSEEAAPLEIAHRGLDLVWCGTAFPA